MGVPRDNDDYKSMLAKINDPQVIKNYRTSVLGVAITRNNPARAISAYENGVNKDSGRGMGSTHLYHAVSMNRNTIADKLIDKGIGVDKSSIKAIKSKAIKALEAGNEQGFVALANLGQKAEKVHQEQNPNNISNPKQNKSASLKPTNTPNSTRTQSKNQDTSR